jgi:N-acyl homoserine lactone hydrolase
MKIHAIKTGDVLVKSAFLGSPANGGLLPYFANIFLDRSRVRIPVLAWAIEHSEGVIIVDTGENAATRGHFISQALFEISPEEEIGAQLDRLGIAKKDISKVVMTHLHGDHMDGLKDFQNTPIWVSEREFKLSPSANARFFSKRGLQNPTLINFNPERFGTFDSSLALTNDGTVFAIPTPGHTAGHLSVVVVEGGIHYVIAGDATYNERALINQTLEGPSLEIGLHRQTLQQIMDYVKRYPTVYLPSHDPASAHRLEAKQTTPATSLRVQTA